MNNNQLNKEHWDKLNKKYSEVWKSKAKQELSKKEMAFISYYLKIIKPKLILDIGVGNGRVVTNYINNSSADAKIYGIDVAPNMVDYCKELFINELKVKEIKTCDIAKDNICFIDNFDFISAIRVLKYNQNWIEIVGNIYEKLNNNGIFIFTMPNSQSISGFHRDTFSEHKLPIIYTTSSELKKILKDIGFEIIEIKAFSRVPDFLYNLNNSNFYTKTLLFIESFLELIFGKKFLGRYFFIACKKIN
ncbi:MAG: class I SAM-dependent methyltransferase [Candidatus Paceibacterota bacterium]|jgi:SAM-dependent methyltransferase